MNHKITFSPLQSSQESLVLGWLDKPHVTRWFYGQGLQNTIKGVKAFISEGPNWFDAWVGYCDGTPFAFLMTFDVKESDADDPECHFGKWVEKDKKSITLDLLIGEEKYLGKGLATPLIKEFLTQVHPDVEIVFIDPDATNKKAIHVYEKAGFKKIDTFIASWHPVPHILMQIKR